MTTFVLIHGAWHGSWCWELLTPELQRRGHDVVAVDLAFEDPELTFDDHARAVVAAVDDDAEVIVVGHSLGGHVVPWVARRRAVRHVIYLCALIAVPGSSLAEQQRAGDMLDLVYLTGVQRVDGCTEWIDRELARSLFYADCDDDVAQAALDRLRPQSMSLAREVCALDPLPAIASTYVVCTEDRMVYPAWSRRVAVERLGVDPVEFPGGHSPFYSRPAELADVLDALA